MLFFDLCRGDAHTRRDEKQIANQELGKLGNKSQARENKGTKATRNRQQKSKNVFFTHNKEKATRKALRGVKSDENKLKGHTQQTTRTNITMRRKPHEIALGGLKRRKKLNTSKRLAIKSFSTHNKEKATRKRFRSYFERAKRKTRQTGAHQQIQKSVQMRKSRQNAKCKVLQTKQSFTRPQMAVRKKTKVFFLTPTKK